LKALNRKKSNTENKKNKQRTRGGNKNYSTDKYTLIIHQKHHSITPCSVLTIHQKLLLEPITDRKQCVNVLNVDKKRYLTDKTAWTYFKTLSKFLR